MKILNIRVALAERKRRILLLESISSTATKLVNRSVRSSGSSISVLNEPCHTRFINAVSIKGTQGELRIGEDRIIYEQVDDPEGTYFVRAHLKDLTTAELRHLYETLKQQLREAKKFGGSRLDRTA